MKLWKKRYVGFKIFSNKYFRKNEILNLIKKELKLINENDKNRMYIRMVKYENFLGILLCDHKSVNIIRHLFDKINKKNEGHVLIKIISISGTIKAIKHKIFNTI